MESFTVKTVGGQKRVISKNEFIMKHGKQLSITLMNQPFVESVAILDENGDIHTTIMKE